LDIRKCYGCGSHNVKPGQSTIKHAGKEIHQVPATICLDCGEKMFLSDVIKRAHRLINAGIYVYKDISSNQLQAEQK